MSESLPGGAAPDRVLETVAKYLTSERPRLLLVSGLVGAGKSSFLRGLLESLPAPRVFMLYQQPMSDPASGPPRLQVGAATTIRMVELDATPAGGGADPAPGTPATGAPGGVEVPVPLADAVARMAATGRIGTVVIDSWDRDSERFLNGIPQAGAAVNLTIPAAAFGAIQGSLMGMQTSLVIGMVPELAAPLQSLSDGLVELHEETRSGARIRIVRIPKLRGSSVEARDHLYSLDGGRFESFPDLPRGTLPPSGPAEPDPEPGAGTIWPGNTAFAHSFGRLRPGGFTGVTLSPEASDPLAATFSLPMIAHVVRMRGHVVWMPAPSIRPSQAVARLKDMVHPDWIRERLRVLSPAGEDRALGELSSVVLPLRREVSQGVGELRTANAPGVGPIFPDAHRFLRQSPDGSPALYVMSIEGLKACAAAAGLSLNAVTLPTVLAAYARIPMFHGFGYGQAEDPTSAPLLTMVDSHLHLQVLCGRPVLAGLRPRTPAFVLDWHSGNAPYSLRACA